MIGPFVRRAAQDVFVRQVGTTVVSQGTALLLSLAIAAITARWLGPAGKGQLALALLVPGLLQMFLGFGINTANVYFAASRRLPVPELTANATAFAWIGTLLGGAIVLVMMVGGLFPVLVPGVPVGLVLLGLLALPLGLFNSNFGCVLQGLRRITTLNVLSILPGAVTVVLLLLLVVWMGRGVEGAILATLAAGGCLLAGTVVCLGREGGVFRPRWNRPVVGLTLGYGLKGYVGSLLQFFNYRLDVLIVNAFVGPLGVGLYGAAVTLAELLWLLSNSVGFVMFPTSAGSDRETMNRFTPRVFWIVLALSSAGAAGLALFGRAIIRILLSDAFSESYAPLLILLPGVVLMGTAKVLTHDMAGRGYLNFCTIIAGASLVVTVTLDLLLIPAMGITGAAMATTAAYALTFVLAAVFYRVVSRRAGKTEARTEEEARMPL